MKSARSVRTFSAPAVALAAGICLLLGFGVGYFAGFGKRPVSAGGPSYPSSTPGLVAEAPSAAAALQAAEVIKELNCVCGCKMVLSTCTCDEVKGSKEIGLFVRSLVDRGMLKPEILTRLQERYGAGILIKKTT